MINQPALLSVIEKNTKPASVFGFIFITLRTTTRKCSSASCVYFPGVTAPAIGAPTPFLAELQRVDCVAVCRETKQSASQLGLPDSFSSSWHSPGTKEIYDAGPRKL